MNRSERKTWRQVFSETSWRVIIDNHPCPLHFFPLWPRALGHLVYVPHCVNETSAGTHWFSVSPTAQTTKYVSDSQSECSLLSHRSVSTCNQPTHKGRLGSQTSQFYVFLPGVGTVCVSMIRWGHRAVLNLGIGGGLARCNGSTEHREDCTRLARWCEM